MFKTYFDKPTKKLPWPWPQVLPQPWPQPLPLLDDTQPRASHPEIVRHQTCWGKQSYCLFGISQKYQIDWEKRKVGKTSKTWPCQVSLACICLPPHLCPAESLHGIAMCIYIYMRKCVCIYIYIYICVYMCDCDIVNIKNNVLYISTCMRKS